MIYLVDLETTGVEEDARVVEVACEVLFPDGEWLVSSREYVNPGVPIPATAKAIHHIDDHDVANADPWDVVAKRIVLEAGFDKVTHFVAHNAAFERRFLDPFVPAEIKWVCTMRCAKHIWPAAPGFSNQTLRYWLPGGPKNTDHRAMPPHRALPDLYVTRFILKSLLKEASLDELVRLTSAPVRLLTVGFGKHFGVPWGTVPSDYLAWVARQPDMDPDVIHTAKTIIQERAR